MLVLQPPRLSSSTIDCRKHSLSITQIRILLQFRIPFSRFLINPDILPVSGIIEERAVNTNQKILKLPCSSLEPRRSIPNHILALAH